MILQVCKGNKEFSIIDKGLKLLLPPEKAVLMVFRPGYFPGWIQSASGYIQFGDYDRQTLLRPIPQSFPFP
jgi:hypothetical protein